MSLPVRPLFLIVLAALALAPTPAHAGRASACKAPPFAVPKETQRAVDAAIDARVVGTGSGGVSAAVENRTDYETTTLSQDAVARAWAQYTLCLKLAKKLISQDLHDELLRKLILPETTDKPAIAEDRDAHAEGSPQEGSAAEHGETNSSSSVVGTWNLVTQFTSGSCPAGISGGNSAYIWLISSTPDGELLVNVQGHTAYDVLHGTFVDGHLRVGAPVNDADVPASKVIAATKDGTEIALLPRADYDLRLEGDALVGQRAASMWASALSADGQTLTILPYTLLYDVHNTQ